MTTIIPAVDKIQQNFMTDSQVWTRRTSSRVRSSSWVVGCICSRGRATGWARGLRLSSSTWSSWKAWYGLRLLNQADLWSWSVLTIDGRKWVLASRRSSMSWPLKNSKSAEGSPELFSESSRCRFDGHASLMLEFRGEFSVRSQSHRAAYPRSIPS